MKRFARIVVLGALLSTPAVAQQGPGPGDTNDGPPPESRQRMEQARDTARAQAIAALSGDHQAKVDAVLTRVKAGQLTDLRDAAHQIDALLTPKESQAVLAARDKLMADMRGTVQGSGAPPAAGPGLAPPSGPGEDREGPPPGGRGGAGHAMRNDPGFAILLLSLDRDQMRSLFANAHPPQ